jgi:hypothetical protein
MAERPAIRAGADPTHTVSTTNCHKNKQLCGRFGACQQSPFVKTLRYKNQTLAFVV